jgi:hypothetical protein
MQQAAGGVAARSARRLLVEDERACVELLWSGRTKVDIDGLLSFGPHDTHARCRAGIFCLSRPTLLVWDIVAYAVSVSERAGMR